MITILEMYTKDCEDLILTGLEKDEEMRYTGVELYEPSGKKFDLFEVLNNESHIDPRRGFVSIQDEIDFFKKHLNYNPFFKRY